MGIMFLTGLLSGAIAIFVIYGVYDKRDKTPEKKIKWAVGLFSAIIGMLLGVIFSVDVGKIIAKKYLASQAPVIVLETINLLPFSNSNGAYIVTGENLQGKKVAWCLQENEELFEKPYDDIIDRGRIVFSNASAPVKQLVKANVGSFWEWFAFIPDEYSFVIPAGGLQEGKILKTYKFIPE